jgi:hypothetical protein
MPYLHAILPKTGESNPKLSPTWVKYQWKLISTKKLSSSSKKHFNILGK